MERTQGDYRLSDNPADQQPEKVHAYLSRSYGAEGIPLDLVRRSLANSLCIGLFHCGAQVGLARVITDRATFAYLCDVYVLEEHRGNGLAKWMMQAVTEHPELQGIRRFTLATRDAHGLYAQFGFKTPAQPESLMEFRRPGLYKSATRGAVPPP
ncbi:MAG TPA: GNAT family N-acetyltransferase [Opitutaceae bacterium]|nr:GNAT family N-acetyltransferase [Opitutaceae bacterium]